MNTFEGITLDDTPSEEIQDEKQYRNKMKKLRQLKTKEPSDENLKKIKILEIQIDEYEDKQKDLKEDTSDKSKSKNKRNKKKKKKKKENEFLEKEFQKNREYWKNYEKEQQQEKIRQEEERRRQQEEKRKRKEEERRRKEDERKWIEMDSLTYARNNKKEFFKKFGINNIPTDLSNVLDNYNHKEYLKLSRVYHPDKSDNQECFKALNEIKDLNNPRSVKHDETWQK